jgi:hypothetical protein
MIKKTEDSDPRNENRFAIYLAIGTMQHALSDALVMLLLRASLQEVKSKRES